MISTSLPNDEFINKYLMVYTCYHGWLLLASRFPSSTHNRYTNRIYIYNPMSRILHQLRLTKGGTVYNIHCREDMIFYDGQFYSINKDGKLYNHNIINARNISSKLLIGSTSSIASECRVKEIGYWGGTTPSERHTFHLVESKNGELLMVERVLGFKSHISKSFRVFKLNCSEKVWEEISDFGCDQHQAQALFLAWNESMFVSIDEEDEEYKPNCIYFFEESLNNGQVLGYGVYDLGNHTIAPFNPTFKITHESVIFGRWFRPSAL